MIRRTLLLTTIVLASLTAVAAAISPIPTPVPRNSARPLDVNRPIFATAAPLKAKPTAAGKTMTLPKHRQPIAAPAKKDGGTGQAGKAGAAPAMPLNRSTPLHRQALGW